MSNERTVMISLTCKECGKTGADVYLYEAGAFCPECGDKMIKPISYSNNTMSNETKQQMTPVETSLKVADIVKSSGRKHIKEAFYDAALGHLADEVRKLRELVNEGRKAGREEALHIILNEDAEMPFADETESYSIGDTGDFGTRWVEDKLRKKLDVEPGAMRSVLEGLEVGIMEACLEAGDLREDKARLDWLSSKSPFISLRYERYDDSSPLSLRAFIDSARKEDSRGDAEAQGKKEGV